MDLTIILNKRIDVVSKRGATKKPLPCREAAWKWGD